MVNKINNKIGKKGNYGEIQVENGYLNHNNNIIGNGNDIHSILNQTIEKDKKINFNDEKISNGNNVNNLNFKRREKRIRSLCVDKNEIKLKSGEAILNQIYQNKKLSNNPISKKLTKSSNNSKVIENGILKMIENEEEYENIENLPLIGMAHIMTNNEEINIRKTLSNHFLFRNITNEVLNLILNELIFFPFPKGRIIYEEGDEGNFFYILASGNVEASIEGKKKKKYSPWECFGELSLITQKKREETLKCIGNVEVFTIDGESFRDILKRINENILKERFNFLNTISIFQSLDNVSKYNVAQKIKIKEFQSGDQIILRGEIGHTLYIIKEGLVSCRIGIKEIRRLGNNDYFGQNAILIDVKRGVDVIALQKTICFELSRSDLKLALGVNYIDVILFCFFKHSIEKNKILKNIFIESQLNDIFKTCKVKIYAKHEKIYDSNSRDKLKSTNKKIVLIIEGSIIEENSSEFFLNKGGILGAELFKNFKKNIPDDLIANPDCITLESSLINIAKIMKIDLNKEEAFNVFSRIDKLKKLYLFKNLSEKTLELLATKLKKLKFNENEVIVEEGQTGDNFYLISKGSVRITKEGNYIRDLESGSCFGENVLLSNEIITRTATVTAIEKTVCYCLSKREFEMIIDDKNIKNFLIKKLSLQDTSITLSDLHYIKFLGKGKFGSVSLVHNKKNIYAIKAISRNSVDKQKMLAKYFVNERRIMLSLDHPFIVKMVKSMKNTFFCFLLIEYINGKNLDEYLSSRILKKNIYETQFYIGSMLLMLDYLQKKSITHRDIKPSNIMIDSNGYLKMIDFGTAKVLTDYTSTVIGTPHYIAPEILQGKGYSLSCDFWSVGICMYEIFYGMYPFGHYANEVIEIYKEILHKDFFFPSENDKYTNVNKLIGDLLNKKVNERVCNVNILKERPFFLDFDFDKLNDFKLTPPFIPQTSDLTQYLSQENFYEDMVSTDHTITKKNYKEDFPPDYDRNWADEF